MSGARISTRLKHVPDCMRDCNREGSAPCCRLWQRLPIIRSNYFKLGDPQVSAKAEQSAQQVGQQAASGGKRAAREAQSAVQQAAPKRGGLFGRAQSQPAGASLEEILSPLHCIALIACHTSGHFFKAHNAQACLKSLIEFNLAVHQSIHGAEDPPKKL